LDVGSGDCQNLWDAEALGFNAYGYDVDKTAGEIAERYGLHVRTGATVDDAYPETVFQLIQLNQVIEHFIDPVDHLQKLAHKLDASGRIFIATPNSGSLVRRLVGKKWINWHVPYHQHHFSKTSLRKMVTKEGWEIESHRTVTPLVWVLLQIRSLRNTPELGQVSRYWKEGSTRRGGRLLELLILGVLFVPVRLTDLFKCGDCQIMVIKRPT
jgi:2-polyprenyl-3-methyl-5-hydroxy-6-metoxy-1,4-benzoquinol methylase